MLVIAEHEDREVVGMPHRRRLLGVAEEPPSGSGGPSANRVDDGRLYVDGAQMKELRILDHLAVKAPHGIRGDFNAGHRENFADHDERRTFSPQFSDAVRGAAAALRIA
jgi:hypothetical protein